MEEEVVVVGVGLTTAVGYMASMEVVAVVAMRHNLAEPGNLKVVDGNGGSWD